MADNPLLNFLEPTPDKSNLVSHQLGIQKQYLEPKATKELIAQALRVEAKDDTVKPLSYSKLGIWAIVRMELLIP